MTTHPTGRPTAATTPQRSKADGPASGDGGKASTTGKTQPATKDRNRTGEADHEREGPPPIKIKKYANRRLYNTATSSYVTLDHLCQMVKDGENFVVTDAKTGEDITRSVLTQIIVEEESKGENLLPIGFLRQLISLYGSNMEVIVPNYLEYTMRAFARNQERMRDAIGNTVGGMFPGLSAWEDMGKQNMAMFEQAMKMFTPFAAGQGETPTSGESAAPDGGAVEDDAADDGGRDASAEDRDGQADIDELRGKLDELQKQLHAIGTRKKS